jgi:hypothetical protein
MKFGYWAMFQDGLAVYSENAPVNTKLHAFREDNKTTLCGCIAGVAVQELAISKVSFLTSKHFSSPRDGQRWEVCSRCVKTLRNAQRVGVDHKGIVREARALADELIKEGERVLTSHTADVLRRAADAIEKLGIARGRAR